MGNEGIDVGALEPVALEQFLAQFRLLADGKLKDLLAILVDVVHSFCDRLLARRVQAAAAGHKEILAAGAIDLVNEVDQTDGVVFGRFKNCRARTVSKDHTSGAVSVVDDRRHYVGADYQHTFLGAAGNQLRSYL